MDLLAGYHDPRRVIAMIDDGSLLYPELTRAFYVRQDIVDYSGLSDYSSECGARRAGGAVPGCRRKGVG